MHLGPFGLLLVDAEFEKEVQRGVRDRLVGFGRFKDVPRTRVVDLAQGTGYPAGDAGFFPGFACGGLMVFNTGRECGRGHWRGSRELYVEEK